MPTNNEIVAIADRGIQGLTEIKAHAIKLSQLSQEVAAKQAELSALEGRIAEAKKMAGEVDEISQLLRTKKVELAEVNAEIARKSVLHGKVDSDLRDLRRRISGDSTHA